MSQRRDFFKHVASVGAAFWAGAKSAYAQQQHDHSQHTPPPAAQPAAARARTEPASVTARPSKPAFNIPMETPDLPKIQHRMVDGWKEFHLTAEPVRFEIVPGRFVDAWGYNGSVPGPTFEVNQGDKVRVVFHNHLPEPTAVHWHGFEVPVEMDGSVGLGQDPVPPGGMFVYEFTLHQAGTFFYHSHMPMQEMMGMIGFFIMHPEKPFEPHCDRDFGLVLQEWALLPNNTVPNTLAMEFNWLTFNGKSGPATTPMIVKQGERVRIRMINIGMDHHPIHLHGTQFVVTGTEGGRSPVATWCDQNTVLVGVAQARDIEFDAKYLGDWMIHCHLPHHMMNQMVSMVGPVGHGEHGGHEGHTAAAPAAPGAPQAGHEGHTAGEKFDPMKDMYPKDDPEKKKVPGYPQDMWMVEDQKYAKPETYGLRRGWTGAMMGMMSIVRVVTPEMYDKIMQLKAGGSQ
jgi:FtsP/CotA-like multicopper oxidase with cupredoxin domain